MDPQILEHVCREQWKGCTEQGTQDGVGGKDGGGIDNVGVDEVVHDGEEDEDHAKAEGGGGDDGDGPVDGGRVGPCEPEETDGEGGTGDHGSVETLFWRCATTSFLGSTDVTFVLVENAVEEGK